MPYGRGGAGNIQNIKQVNEPIEADLEANRLEAEAASSGRLAEQLELGKSRATDQGYVHIGRGGAGNWSSSSELSEPEPLASPIDPTSIRSTSTSQESGEIKYTGRGGAGNYQWNAEKEAQAKQEIEEKELELQELVKKDVEAGLTPPNKAYLGNGSS